LLVDRTRRDARAVYVSDVDPVVALDGGGGVDPLEVCLEREDRDEVLRAARAVVGRLSPRQREIVALHARGRRRPDELIFASELGGPICESGLYKRFKAAATRAGLPSIRFHDLRHSFGTQAIQRFDIYTVARMMGHASIKTTEKYLHYRPDPAAANVMDELWNSQRDVETPVEEAQVIELPRAA
jgi:integrase